MVAFRTNLSCEPKMDLMTWLPVYEDVRVGADMAAGINCDGAFAREPRRIAADVSLQSSVKISIRVPKSLGDKKLRIQIGGLTAAKPPEVLFEVSLRCMSTKAVYHLG